jgi:lipopolysaccharide transport system permease protein
MGNYLAAIWRCRYFWLSLVRNDLRMRYRRSMLGMGWSLLHPIAMTAILCVVFHKIFRQPVEVFAPLLLSGLACWNYILNVTAGGCQCILQGETYIRQYPAPMAIYPLRTALGGTVHFLIALAVVLVLVWIMHGFGNLPALWCLVPTLVLLFLLVWSLAVLAGFANVYFQDTQHLTDVGFQILFYATPIIYPASVLRDNNLGWVLRYNPLVRFLNLIREPILAGQVPSMKNFVAAGLTVLVVSAAAVLALARLQRRVIFQL